MVAVEKGSLVLVTGASGFIATHVVRELLESGFKVRGTVRSDSKGRYLWNLFKDVGEFEYILVPDMAKEGAYDEAVLGFDAVVHTASPFHFKVSHPGELIDPAIGGTVGVLKSITKNGDDRVKRVVVTSSCAAVQQIDSVSPPYTFHDDDWNTDAPRIAEEQQEKTSGVVAYLASKSIAEQAFWKYIKDNGTRFDEVALNPPQVFGELIHECDSVNSINTSLAEFYQFLVGGVTEQDLEAKTGVVNWVNVKDLAKAHASALLVPEAGGNRFIVSAGPFAHQDHADALHKLYPDIKDVPRGQPGTHDELCKNAFFYNSDKAKRVLGVEFTSWDDTIVDMTDSLRARFGI